MTIKSTPASTQPAITAHHHQPSSKPFQSTNATLSHHTTPITQTVVNSTTPSKVQVIHPDPIPSIKQSPKTFFQGVSEWSERKEPVNPRVTSTALRPTTLNTTAFQEELKGTLERNRLKHNNNANTTAANIRGSREDLLSDTVYRMNTKTDRNYGSRGDLRQNRNDDDYRQIKTQKEDLGYLSGSRNDVRHASSAGRRESQEDVYALSKKQSAYLHREDSGYAKDSREDVRYPARQAREDSFIRDSGEEELRSFNKTAIQRDDSAYVSSSTYFTAPRSPKSPKSPKILTPDSGIRSPSPDMYDSEVGVVSRPTVPQRKRVLEKKMRQQSGSQQHINRLSSQEPQPDYPRSRSVTPPTARSGTEPNNGGMKKYQRTRFASQDRGIPPSSSVTQSTQTLNRAGVANPSKSSAGAGTKVGTAIGNSLRKLVGKIRSASAERKLKIKTNTKRSPSPSQKANPAHHKTPHHHLANYSPGGSTYQQYNVIDGHIGNHTNNITHSNHNHKQHISGSKNHLNHIHNNNNNNNNHTKPPLNRESSVVSSNSGIRRERSAALDRRGSSDLDMASPKQKYYLGEDPYGGNSIFGKENRYEQQQQRGGGGGDGPALAPGQHHGHRSRRQAPRYPGDEVSSSAVRHEKLPVKSSSTLLFNGVANR